MYALSTFTQHGTLRVPRADDALYREAKAYLSRDPLESKLFRELEHAPDGRSYQLTINHRGDDHFDPNDNEIAWDPYSALRTTRGGLQSPALGLGHEVDHAVEDPATEARLQNIPDGRYDNAEERRVITGSETHAARVLGESVRYDHSGTLYRVPSPIAR
jgi:site-specific DNA-cytosine methylase